MASVRDQSFFNVLFKAVEQFYRAPEQRFATVAWQGRAYFVYKKTALKIFRNLVPAFRTVQYKDDDSLVRYLYERKNADYNLIKLTRQSEENILTNEAHNEFEKIALKEPSEHEQALEMWTDKHTHEETLSQTTQETTEEKDNDKKKKGLLQMLRGKGGGFNLNLPTKWLKNLAQKAYQKLIQPAIRAVAQTAGKIITQLVPKLANAALNFGSRFLSSLGGLSSVSISAVLTAFTWAIAITIGTFFLAALWTTFFGFARSDRPIHYTLPIRNSNIVPTDAKAQEIKDMLIKNWPNAQIQNWDLIVLRAKDEGWNPTLLLTLWIVASKAQGEEGYLDPLGCKPNPQQPNQDINKSLECFFQEFANNRFDVHASNFLRQWTNGFDPKNQNPGLINDIEYWYSLMIPSGEGAIKYNQPTTTLDYTLPLRDTSVAFQDLRPYIQKKWENAKIDNWQIIVDQAIDHGWNPAVLLALWMEESGAQGVPYDDPLGCDPKNPTEDIQVSLDCFFNSFDNKFTRNDQFAEFMLTYSAPNDPTPFFSNPNFPKNFKEKYDMLVPSGPGATQPITTPGGPSGISGCPVIGTITNPYGYNLPDYPYKNLGCADTQNNCHNGIDIGAAVGTDIRSPMKGIATRGYDGPKGNFVIISESEGTYNPLGVIITFDHLSAFAEKFAISPSIVVDKGDIIGKTGDTGESTGPHLHYQINKGSNNPQNPLVYLKGAATIDSDVLTENLDLAGNNYAQIRHQPGSNTINWGQCNVLPSP